MVQIRIVAPASPRLECDKEGILNGFKNLGVEASFGTHTFDFERFMAGSDAHRAQDLMEAFLDPSVDMIVALRGGYGSGRLLDLLDMDVIRQNPKPLFGFSDITALQLGLLAKADLISFSGLIASYFLRENAAQIGVAFQQICAHEALRFEGLKTRVSGKASGRLIGGNLSVLAGLIGTPYLPDLSDAILVLEEVSEEPYKIDRLLTQLKQTGIFNQIAGVVLGDFYKCLARDPLDGTVEDVLKEHFDVLDKPVVSGLKYSHNQNEVILPIGAEAMLDADKGILKINEY